MTGGPELFAVEIGHDRIIAGSRLSRLTSSVAAIFLLVSSSIMSTHEKETFIQTYQWARDWSQLPWAHDEPTLFLAELCKQRGGRGRALDIGCGAGTDSVYLAEQGWEVTALDFVPKALEFTQARAEAAGVSVQAVEADITTWDVPHAYDLVLDHGLLHNMDPVRYPAYRERLIDAVAPDGDFVLLHWHPSYPGQTNGEVGPTRRSRDDIKAFFAPEFQERFFAQEEFEDLPAMVGGGMAQAYYWFRRNQAHWQPAELVEQVRQTLQRNGYNIQPGEVPAVADNLLARLVGPGRLGISHRVPADADAPGILADWAAGASGDAVSLLHQFASEAHANLCGEMPKCGDCAVSFCKRLRYR
jgi:SAM-dependent methyltransferase